MVVRWRKNNNKMGLSLDSVPGAEMIDVPKEKKKTFHFSKAEFTVRLDEVTSCIIKMNGSLSHSVLIRVGMRESWGRIGGNLFLDKK